MVRRNKRKNNKGSTLLITIILALSIIFMLIYVSIFLIIPGKQSSKKYSLYFENQKATSTLNTQAITTPTPMPIATGRQSYTISSNTKTGPAFKKIIFNPLDPKIGSTQTISANITGDNPIVSVSVVLTSDNNVQSKGTLTLTGGTSQSGTWQTDIIYQNSYSYTYNFTLVATDITGKTKNISLGIR